MAKSISLHIGLNRVDPAHYGSECPLIGCINDAKAMESIAVRSGFTPTVLIDQQATSGAIFDYLVNASRTLVAGDTLFVTFAGHGALTADENNDERRGGMDQTWCVFDRMIVDDELAEQWAEFAAGVRILFVSDSCHSGSVARALELVSRIGTSARSLQPSLRAPVIGDVMAGNRIVGYRTLPEVARATILSRHKDAYSSIQQQTRGTEITDIRATLVSLSACDDDQTAADGEKNGLYTSTLISVWNNGAFGGTYADLQARVAAAVGERQTPQYKRFGAPNPGFEAEQPFGSRPVQSSGTGDVHMSLTVPRAYIDQLHQDDVDNFLRKHGVDMVMQALVGASKLSSANGGLPSGTQWGVKVGDSVKISVQF